MKYLIGTSIAYLIFSLLILWFLWGYDRTFKWAKVREAFSWPWIFTTTLLAEWRKSKDTVK